jgi:BirA family biotin operon repressor/biotin-[acetyl-CoA-carboxylase] ligase
MADASSDLAPERVLPLLRTQRLGRAYDWMQSCASTNDECAARARSGAPEGLVVVAEAQTGGRGRMGRTWHSPAGENLYASLLLRPPRPAAEIPPVTLLAGAAVAGALVAAFGVRTRLKWPNDVLLDDGGRPRKLAGILTEMSSEGDRVGHVVVGLGLNVNGTTFPPELADRATSLRRVTGRALDRGQVVAALLASFEALYDEFCAQGPAPAVAAWRQHAALGERWRVSTPGRDGTLEGIVLDVDADGALRLRDDGGHIHRVLSGEVLS